MKNTVKIGYNVILCGFMGSGKTTVGETLSGRLCLNFIDTDKYIESKFGLTVSDIFDKYGEHHFRQLENNLSKDFDCFVPSVIALGGGFLEHIRDIDCIKRNGKLIFLDASLPVISDRLKDDHSRPLLRDFLTIKSLFYSRLETYKRVSDFIVCADDSKDTICDNILNILNLEKI